MLVAVCEQQEAARYYTYIREVCLSQEKVAKFNPELQKWDRLPCVSHLTRPKCNSHQSGRAKLLSDLLKLRLNELFQYPLVTALAPKVVRCTLLHNKEVLG